ncbi:hypothetical protein AJ80_04245 [Polytolypa hystricis UAMH7299]|uniref:Translation initiation factor eIF2B subunit beta n=1 Tax=Polytolypa hystricis (strain UAMH7299) TaxID=1447883 RepID=A0A2B7YD17_POLH7|nr:hypothetical protein AJ80_04245 [Polytolypa hystricis UAMH7299]
MSRPTSHLTPGLQSFYEVMNTNPVEIATDYLISLLKRRQIRQPHSCAVATARLLLRVVTTSRTTDPAKMIERVQNVGRRLIAAHPREMVVGNIVRRVLGLIREESESDHIGDFTTLSSDAGSDTRPHTPGGHAEGQFDDENPGIMTQDGPATHLRRENTDVDEYTTATIDATQSLLHSLSTEAAERLPSRPPAVGGAQSYTTTAAPAPPVISMFSLLSHPTDSPQPSSPVPASPTGRLNSEPKDLRAEVIEGITEILDELSQADDQIAAYALDHIHSNEVILTHSSSLTVQKFLLKAAAKRQFTVIHAEAYPNNHQETHAVVNPANEDDEEQQQQSSESFKKALTDHGVTVILIPDSAVFAMMSRVNKVILGTHSVLANGGLVAAAGARVVANAAKVHKTPVVVVSGVYKLSPIYPFDYASLIEYGDTSAVVGYEDGDLLDKIEVENPLYDYVPAELVDLYVTNLGGHAPSYLYRIVADHYRTEDISF